MWSDLHLSHNKQSAATKKWCFHVFYWTFTVQDGHSMWTPWLMNSSRANWSQVSANLESNLCGLKWPRPLQNTHQFWVCYIAWCEAWLKQKSSQKTYNEDLLTSMKMERVTKIWKFMSLQFRRLSINGESSVAALTVKMTAGEQTAQWGEEESYSVSYRLPEISGTC